MQPHINKRYTLSIEAMCWPIIGCLYPKETRIDPCLTEIKKTIQSIHHISDPFSYHHTPYYTAEMGPTLEKRFFTLSHPIPYDGLIQIKEQCGQIENKFRRENETRQFNLDPTIITLHNVMLLSFKNYTHRIPLNTTIFAELALLYQNKHYVPLQWSYPDFRKPDYYSIFMTARNQLKKQQPQP